MHGGMARWHTRKCSCLIRVNIVRARCLVTSSRRFGDVPDTARIRERRESRGLGLSARRALLMHVIVSAGSTPVAVYVHYPYMQQLPVTELAVLTRNPDKPYDLLRDGTT